MLEAGLAPFSARKSRTSTDKFEKIQRNWATMIDHLANDVDSEVAWVRRDGGVIEKSEKCAQAIAQNGDKYEIDVRLVGQMLTSLLFRVNQIHTHIFETSKF